MSESGNLYYNKKKDKKPKKSPIIFTYYLFLDDLLVAGVALAGATGALALALAFFGVAFFAFAFLGAFLGAFLFCPRRLPLALPSVAAAAVVLLYFGCFGSFSEYGTKNCEKERMEGRKDGVSERVAENRVDIVREIVRDSGRESGPPSLTSPFS